RDQHFIHFLPFRTRLVRYQGSSQDGPYLVRDLLDTLGEYHAPGTCLLYSAFTAATSVDLRFDHEPLCTRFALKFFGRGHSAIGGVGDDAALYGDAKSLENFFTLVFVNVHVFLIW